MVEIRDAELPRDLVDVLRLWLDYLSWGNNEMESRHGFRLPVEEAIEHDVATIGKFDPPDGRILLASEEGVAIGTASMRLIGPETAEIKRMWVDPFRRGSGTGRAMLDRLVMAAREAGYKRIRLDSPDFMVAAHGLYRSSRFVDIGPYPESEIPDAYKSHWVFMERTLA